MLLTFFFLAGGGSNFYDNKELEKKKNIKTMTKGENYKQM